ncbi:Transposase IS4 [Popillia japonica]|uniref:Transposase IS4 n=1 Tax=Popillia japonica TaxID=7064 RepID=A0AAW1MFU4_POPJA
MVCDSSSKYMINAELYLEKDTNTSGLPLANYHVNHLTKSVHGSNRNLTMDTRPTSVPMAEEMLGATYKLTPELLESKPRDCKTSMFCFDQKGTVVSYMRKRTKIVSLLSTLHKDKNISENGKLDIALNYDKTKEGVDRLDQLCSSMTCSRKTPPGVFFGMLKVAILTSYRYCCNKYERNEKSVLRYNFMIELDETWMHHKNPFCATIL